jgi:hypothetical protein
VSVSLLFNRDNTPAQLAPDDLCQAKGVGRLARVREITGGLPFTLPYAVCYDATRPVSASHLTRDS